MKALGYFLFVLLASAILFAQNPVPYLNQPVVPASVAPGGAAFTLTVNGTGFATGAVLNWNGSSRPTTVVSSSVIHAQISAADIATATTAIITVVNPGGAVSGPAFLSVTNPRTVMGYPQTSSVTAYGGYVMTADLNHDGKPDVLVTYEYVKDRNIAVLLGNGDGTLQPAVYYTAGQHVLWPTIGDFNGDGFPDVAVVGLAASNPAVYVLLNLGDGTFGTAVPYKAGRDAWNLTNADFNNDGKLDLAIADPSYHNVNILLGNGDGTFQPRTSFHGANTTNVGVGDFNGDGQLDLLTSNFTGLSVMLGNGDGTFQAPINPVNIAVGNPPGIADFNGDGRLDLAVEQFNGAGDFCILLGNGDGSFGAPVFYPQTILTGMAIADLDGDGKLDIAVSGAAAEIMIYKGNGDGTFQLQFQKFQITGFEPFTAAAADFDGDGRMDLVTANSFNNTLSLMIQSPTVLDPSFLSFGTQALGSHTTKVVTLTNTDDVTLSMSGVKISSRNTIDFTQTNTCGTSVPPGGSCQFTLTFTPSKSGKRTAEMFIKDSSRSSQQVIPLSGTGQ
jgi:hypothetical protein